MKSTFALFVLCAVFCLSANAQAAHRSPMKMNQLQKVALQKEATQMTTTVKKEKQLPPVTGNTKRKEVFKNYYLPTGRIYGTTVKSNNTDKKLQETSTIPVKNAKKE